MSHLFTLGNQNTSFSISPSSEYSEVISLKNDLFYSLAVQGTVKSFLQHQNSKASILWCSAFFMVQLSHLYMIAGRIIGLDYMDLCQQSDVLAF